MYVPVHYLHTQSRRLMLTEAFRIDADDTSTGALPAMSRPPSRADQPIDLTQDHATATADVRRDFQVQDEANDADLQRAINMSLGQEMPEQENGVTGFGQQFGKAERAYYDPVKWSMMPIASSREVVNHPPPEKRRRIEGQPAFLQGSKDTGYLASLLTIYHNIPLAREALLLPSMNVLAYGHDPSWWSGTSDENIKSLSVEAEFDHDRAKVNLLAENQCLMAFLDDTQRAYGSVNALADLDSVRTTRTTTPYQKALVAWEEASMSLCPDEQLDQVFTTTATKLGADQAMNSRDIVGLDFPAPWAGQPLVDVLDTNIWHDEINEDLDDVWFSNCAEVFTMRLYDPQNKPEGLGIPIPLEWYPDRYTFDCRARSHQMRTETQLLQKEIAKYAYAQRQCMLARDRSGALVNVKDVINSANQTAQTMGSNNDAPPGRDPDQAALQSAKAELETIMSRIDQKLELLEIKKNEFQAQVREIMRQLTEPSSDPDEPPFMKYHLQGLSTKPNVTYLRRRNEDLLGLDETTHAEWKWWRISWSVEAQKEQLHPPMIGPATQAQATAAQTAGLDGWAPEPDRAEEYSVTEVSEQDVLRAAEVESHTVVLVYANENAINRSRCPLSSPLKKFVEQDNLAFARELRGDAVPREESEQASSETLEDVPLDDDESTQRPDRDYTPMSIGSPHRDEDGQPSPKRPKSSDSPVNTKQGIPPSYNDTIASPEMQEVRQNKIGMYAEKMLERYGHDRKEVSTDGYTGPVHVEHSTDLPR